MSAGSFSGTFCSSVSRFSPAIWRWILSSEEKLDENQVCSGEAQKPPDSGGMDYWEEFLSNLLSPRNAYESANDDTVDDLLVLEIPYC